MSKVPPAKARPSTRNQLLQYHCISFVFVLAIPLAACRKAALPNAITQAEVKRLASQAPVESQGVVFGGRYTLLAAVLNQKPGGLAIDLVWKSLAAQRREGLVPVHLVDAGGAILGQADYRQDKNQGKVPKGALWRDEVVIPYEKLRGCSGIALGLLNPGEQWLLADRGPRDWGNRRLLLPLPADLPSQSATSSGFLEVVNARHIIGWAWKREAADTPLQVEILDGDRVLTNVLAADFRADLKAGAIGNGTHGFCIDTPQALKDGRIREIHARVASDKNELKNSPRTITVR